MFRTGRSDPYATFTHHLYVAVVRTTEFAHRDESIISETINEVLEVMSEHLGHAIGMFGR